MASNKYADYSNPINESNYYANLFSQLEPYQEPKGYFATAIDAAKAGAGGVIGGLGSFSQANLGVGQGVADWGNNLQQGGQRQKQYSWGDMIPFASDYYTNPQGLTYDVAQGAGSSLALLPAGAAIGAAAPEIGLGAGATALAARLGLGGLGKAATSKLGSSYLLSKVPEAMSEGGNAYADMVRAGVNPEIARQQGNEVAIKNVPLLMAEGLGDIAGFKGLAGAVATKAGGSVLANTAKSIASNIGSSMVMEGATEAGQQMLQENAMRRALGQQEYNWWQPEAYTPDVMESARAGMMMGLPFGAAGVVNNARKGFNRVASPDITGQGINDISSELPNIAQGIQEEVQPIVQIQEQPQQMLQLPVTVQEQNNATPAETVSTDIGKQSPTVSPETTTTNVEQANINTDKLNTKNAVIDSHIVKTENTETNTDIPTMPAHDMYSIEPLTKSNGESSGRYNVRDADGNKVNSKALSSGEAQAMFRDLTNATPKSKLGIITDPSISNEKVNTEGYTVRIGGMDVFLAPEKYQDEGKTKVDWSAYDMNGHPIIDKNGEHVSNVESFANAKEQIKKATFNGNVEKYTRKFAEYKVGKNLEEAKKENATPVTTSQMSRDEQLAELNKRFRERGKLIFRSEEAANEFASTVPEAVVDKVRAQGNIVFRVRIPGSQYKELDNSALMIEMNKQKSLLEQQRKAGDAAAMTKTVSNINDVQAEMQRRINEVMKKKEGVASDNGSGSEDSNQKVRGSAVRGAVDGSYNLGGSKSEGSDNVHGQRIRPTIEELAQALKNKAELSGGESYIHKALLVKQRVFKNGHAQQFTEQEIEDILHDILKNKPNVMDVLYEGSKSKLNIIKSKEDIKGCHAYYYPNTNTVIFNKNSLEKESQEKVTSTILHEGLHHLHSIQKIYAKHSMLNWMYKLADKSKMIRIFDNPIHIGATGLSDVKKVIDGDFRNSKEAIETFRRACNARAVFADYFNIMGSMVKSMRRTWDINKWDNIELSGEMLSHQGNAGVPAFELASYGAERMDNDNLQEYVRAIINDTTSYHTRFNDMEGSRPITLIVNAKKLENGNADLSVRFGTGGTANREYKNLSEEELISELKKTGIPAYKAKLMAYKAVTIGIDNERDKIQTRLVEQEIHFSKMNDIYSKYFQGTDGIRIEKSTREGGLGAGSKVSSPSAVLGKKESTARIYRLAQAADEAYKKLAHDYVPFIKSMFDSAKGTRLHEMIEYADREKEFAQVAKMGDKYTVLGLNDQITSVNTDEAEKKISELKKEYQTVYSEEVDGGKTMIIATDSQLHDSLESAQQKQKEQMKETILDLGYTEKEYELYNRYRGLMDRFYDLTSKMDKAFGRKPLEYTQGYMPHIVDRFILTKKEEVLDENGDPVLNDKGEQIYRFVDLSSHGSQSDAIKQAKDYLKQNPALKDMLTVREKNTEAKASAVKAMYESGQITEEEFNDLKDSLGYSEQQAKDALTKDVNLYKDVADAIRKAVKPKQKINAKELIAALRADDSINADNLRNSNMIKYLESKETISRAQAIAYLNYIGGRHKFAEYRMERKGNEAYIKDVEKSTYIYADKVFKYLSQEPFVYKATKQYEKAFGKSFDKEATTDLEKYTKRYINDMRGVPSSWDAMMDQVVRDTPVLGDIMTRMFGAQPASTMIRNMTQLQTACNLWFGNVSSAVMQLGAAMNINAKLDGADPSFNPTKYAGFGKNTVSAMARVGNVLSGRVTEQTLKDRRILKDVALDLGENLAGGEFTDPYSLFKRGKVGEWVEKTGYLFNKSDMFFRQTAALGFYTQAEKQYDARLKEMRGIISKYNITRDDVNNDMLDSKGLNKNTRAKEGVTIAALKAEFERATKSSEQQAAEKHDYCLQYAKDMAHVTNFNYAKYDTPEFLRSKSAIMANILQFKKYPAKQMEFICRELTRNGNPNTPEFRTFIANVILVGGIFGFPGTMAIAAIFKGLFNVDPEDEARKRIMQWAGRDKDKQTLAKIALYGIGSTAGVDVSKRMGMGDFIPTKLADWLGPTYGWSNRVLDTVQKQPIEAATIPKYIRAMVPSLGNYALALSGENLDSGGKLGKQYTTGERAMRFMGFIPIDEAVTRDKSQLLKDLQKQRQDEINYAMEKLNMNPNDSRAREVLNEYRITGKQISEYRKSASQNKEQRLEKQVPKKQKAELGFISEFK